MSIETIKNKISPILRKYPISEAFLFGSVARGEDRPDSDVDILVKFTRMGDLFEFVGIKLELEENLGKKVHLVQDEALRQEFRPNVEKEKVRIL